MFFWIFGKSPTLQLPFMGDCRLKSFLYYRTLPWEERERRGRFSASLMWNTRLVGDWQDYQFWQAWLTIEILYCSKSIQKGWSNFIFNYLLCHRRTTRWGRCLRFIPSCLLSLSLFLPQPSLSGVTPNIKSIIIIDSLNQERSAHPYICHWRHRKLHWKLLLETGA